MYLRVWTVIFILQSGHSTISFNLSTFFGGSTTSTIASSTTISSTGSLLIFTLGLALDGLGLALGLISSCFTISSFTISSFTISSSWLII